MMKKLRNLLNWTAKPEAVETIELYFLEQNDDVANLDAPQNDATRPSYRVGKHQSVDFFKAIDLSG